MKTGKKQAARKRGEKGVSVKEIIHKTADAIKRPFGGKRSRRNTREIAEAEERVKMLENENAGLEDVFDTYENGGDQPGPFGNFFYVNDGFISRFEDDVILKYIRDKFPGFDPGRGRESALRNSVIAMLKDSDFMQRLLERYSLSIFDFFKFLFRMDSSIYKGSFIHKIQKTINRKKYASSIFLFNLSLALFHTRFFFLMENSFK